MIKNLNFRLSKASQPNPEVNWFYDKPSTWQAEYNLLRKIALGCGLGENLKWGKPTFGIDSNIIFLIHGFKDYCAILFFKGVLMSDPSRILVQQTKNVQASRQLRFNSVEQIQEMDSIIKSYILEAIKTEQSGAKIEFKKTSEFKMVEEFQTKLAENSDLADAYYALTPGRQRGYLLFFCSAKQVKTREVRISKSTPYIMRGKGILKGGGFEK
jgi:uncharacterized protein YdeI (YjbR/CyaY-like superfamily)